MTGFTPPVAGAPSPTLGLSLPNPRYGGVLGLGAPGGRSTTSRIFCSPPAPRPSLPIAASAARTPSSHSVEANVQRLHSAKDTTQDHFRLTSIWPIIVNRLALDLFVTTLASPSSMSNSSPCRITVRRT